MHPRLSRRYIRRIRISAFVYRGWVFPYTFRRFLLKNLFFVVLLQHFEFFGRFFTRKCDRFFVKNEINFSKNGNGAVLLAPSSINRCQSDVLYARCYVLPHRYLKHSTSVPGKLCRTLSGHATESQALRQNASAVIVHIVEVHGFARRYNPRITSPSFAVTRTLVSMVSPPVNHGDGRCQRVKSVEPALHVELGRQMGFRRHGFRRRTVCPHLGIKGFHRLL